MLTKAIDEYELKELPECVHHARQIAMAAINNIYADIKDDDVPCDADIYKITKAVQILETIQHITPVVNK